MVELGRVASPFGVTVTAEGHHIYELTAWITGLPQPEEVGPYTALVAWATTPYLDPVVKLGVVRNGRNALGRIHFNKFLVLISAEPSADVAERQGRLILRGRSPSVLMEGHDLFLQAPAALQRGPGAANATRWPRPPMYPDIPMLPGMMDLSPRVRPLLPTVESVDEIAEVRPSLLVRLGDGGTLDLEAGLVRRRIKDRTLVMLGFNGQHPGPLIQVLEKSTIFVNLTNNTPFPTSVHWHGVRLDNRFDGVPGVTQEPVMPGETFRYQVYFKDAGIYWYHPHHREDLQQELGLYGNILVDSRRPDFLNPVNREEVLMLDDLLLDDAGIVAFGEESANYALMGRFGNIFLVNGEPGYDLEVKHGDVVRFFLTNAANTRTFNLSFARLDGSTAGPLPIKVVGSDLGKFEREEMVGSVVVAPAERFIVEVRFGQPGEYALVNQVQAIDHRTGTFFPETSTLGIVRVEEQVTEHDHAHAFGSLRENLDVVGDIDRYRDGFDRPVDHELLLTLEVQDLPLAVEQVMLYDWIYFNPVEWGGTMPIMNWLSTGQEIRWVLRDLATGKENGDIDWRGLKVGDVVKIRLHNDRYAFHAMQHPLHIHGQRFLVLEQNGVPNTNLVWKDTVLLPTGSTTDILLELSNPGRWMVHCHIAEHLEAGMKFVMDVEGDENAPP